MNIDKYLADKVHSKRILIVSDLVKGQDLIKRYEEKTGELINNLVCMTLSQIVKQLDVYLTSKNGFQSSVKIISSAEAMMFFRNVMLDNLDSLDYFNDVRMLDISTSMEIFNKVNLVRLNGWTGEETNSLSSRISDIKLLISAYEQRLKQDKIVDAEMLLINVLNEIKASPNVDDLLDAVFAADISYICEDTDKYSATEKELLNSITNAGNNAISVFNNDPNLESVISIIGKPNFYKGYGSYNEVAYIANDILAKKLAFGDVVVLYTSSTQLPSITSTLRGNGIKTRIISGYPAKDNPYISLARTIIGWAKNDYTEVALEKIFSSGILYVPAKKENGDIYNLVSGQKYFDYILDAKNRWEDRIALGWGYNRNLEFINHEKKSEDENRLKLVEMHEALIDIFGSNQKGYDDDNTTMPIVIFRKLIAFIEKYTAKSADLAAGIEGLKKIALAVEYETCKMTLTQATSFIEELICKISISDSEDSSSVSVKCIDDWTVLNRKEVYVVGLALKDMQGNTTESPILFDDEIEKYIGDGYKPTIRKKSELREKNIYRTLMSYSGNEITFGYSSYDTVAFCENNPSSLFRDMLENTLGSAIGSIDEFVYGNPVASVQYNYDYSVGNTDGSTKDYELKQSSSSSSIERMLDCPKRYYYEKIIYVPDNNYADSNYSSWLDAGQKGSFFHAILEQYVNQKLIRPDNEVYDDAPDITLIEEIAKKTEEEMLITAPVAFRDLADSETKELIDYAVVYLNKLQADLNESKWRCLGTELRFIKSKYLVKDYQGNEHSFEFNGIIDRIDYKLDENLKKINIRIADYKTGRKDKKERDKNHGTLIQYMIYRNAIMYGGIHPLDREDNSDVKEELLSDYLKNRIANLTNNPSVKDYEMVFKYFEYVFPMEIDSKLVLDIQNSEMESLNITRFKSILSFISENKRYPDKIDLYEAVKTYSEKYGEEDKTIDILFDALSSTSKDGEVNISDKETDHCKYCDYGYLCIKRKAGEI